MQIQGLPYYPYEVIATTEPILHVINTIYSADVPTFRLHYGSLFFNTGPVLPNTQLRLLLVRTVTTSRLIVLIISATFLKHPLVLSINPT